MEPLIFHPVIMAGGVGSRLWPLSRKSFPKQFQTLLNSDIGHSMLQHTCQRLEGLHLQHGQLICHQDHRFLAAEQLRTLSLNYSMDVVLEPDSRNTAPAVLIAALRLLAVDKDHPMLVLAADHAIDEQKAFQQALLEAHPLAEQGLIVTLGVVPTFASTGYGYLHKGDALAKGFKVARFVEKPAAAAAQSYYDSGHYFWNSGMFIVRPSTLIAEAKNCCPALLNQCENALKHSFADLDFIRLESSSFSQCQNTSIDYAVMEKTQKAAMVQLSCGWSDVGDLVSLKAANTADQLGNVTVGDVEMIASNNCYVNASNKLVVTLGISNLAVVETKDAVLVADLGHSQQVKDIVEKLQGRSELSHHREVYRPWGSYDSIDVGSNYQVKKITVNPGARLSLQRHQHRAEHWVVVDGIATVHLDGKEHELHTNQSIYIPKTSIHSLGNNTDKPLHLIEVQSGNYLGEDDIERLDDQYGRIS